LFPEAAIMPEGFPRQSIEALLDELPVEQRLQGWKLDRRVQAAEVLLRGLPRKTWRLVTGGSRCACGLAIDSANC